MHAFAFRPAPLCHLVCFAPSLSSKRTHCARKQDVAPGPTCTTAADGTCSVDLAPLLRGRFGALSALVSAPGHGLLAVAGIDTPYVPSDGDGGSGGSGGSSGTPWAAELVLDRFLVSPGDALHVTGYVQRRDGAKLSLPPAAWGANATLVVSPNWNQSASGEPVKIPVKIDPDYGSLHTNVSVPATAQLLQYEVSLEIGGGSPAAATEQFLVADPRPPTAVLNLTAPDWAPPNATVKALITARSYLGADVSGAAIKVTWTVPLASGSVNVTTDAHGRAVARVPLGALPAANATKAGDALEVRAEWVDATGTPYIEKRIVRCAVAAPLPSHAALMLLSVSSASSVSLPHLCTTPSLCVPLFLTLASQQTKTTTQQPRLAEGPVRATATRSPATDVPGVPFIISAATFLEDADQTPIEGVRVEVAVVPGANATASLANCSAVQRLELARQRCVVTSGAPSVSGDGRACELVLPCAGDLMLRACAVSFVNGTRVKSGLPSGRPPCSSTPVGRNASAWAKSPWALQPALRLLPDRANYTLGANPVLSFSVPPYAGATSGLLIWGNGDSVKRRALARLAPGPNRVSLGPVGGECLGGCKVALVLAAGRRWGEEAKARVPAIAPVSKLFDPLGPHTMADTVQLRVVGDDRLDVAIAVAGADSGDGSAPAVVGGREVAALAPLRRASVRVSVRDAASGAPAAGAEVTVVMVDRAVLDLMPYALKDVADAIAPQTDLFLSLKDINGARASRAAINATFSALRRRLAADPWLPLDATVTPSRAADRPDWGFAAYYPAPNPVDVPDSVYLAKHSSPVTVTPFYTWGITQRYPAASRGAGDAGAALRLSGDFKVTPLFATAVAGADGVAAVEFDATANLGEFAVRAYAVSKGAKGAPSKYGSNETGAVVRLPVSLTPAVPR